MRKYSQKPAFEIITYKFNFFVKIIFFHSQNALSLEGIEIYFNENHL